MGFLGLVARSLVLGGPMSYTLNPLNYSTIVDSHTYNGNM